MSMNTLHGDRVFRAQGPGLPVAVLISVLIGGTIGYHLIEGWSVWRSFYVTVLAITTLELPSMSRYGQAFTLLVLFSGIGAALYTFTLLATVVVEGGLPKRSDTRLPSTKKYSGC